jgi:hypothetical protein
MAAALLLTYAARARVCVWSPKLHSTVSVIAEVPVEMQ